jgi:hypothetical protein
MLMGGTTRAVVFESSAVGNTEMPKLLEQLAIRMDAAINA